MDPIGIDKISAAVLEALSTSGIGFTVSVDMGPDERRIAFANDRACQIVGRPREELVGQSATMPLAPEEVERLNEQRRRRMAGEAVPTRYETVIIRPDGTRVPIEVGMCRFVLDGRPATASFMTDLTEQRRVQNALTESEARFRTLIEAAPDVLFVCRGPKLVYANPAMATMLGYASVDEIQGIDARDFMSPEDVRNMVERWDELGAGGGPMPAAERRVRRKDGTWTVIEAVSMRIQYDGQPAIMGFGRDVSQRQALHQQILQNDRMAAVGTLRRPGVAHEINNPLAYVMLNLDMAIRELPRAAGNPARLTELVEKLVEAREGAERVAVIVRDLLSFARSDESWGPVDLRRCFEAAAKMVRSDLEQRANLVLTFADLPPVDGNSARLGQVFLNLLVNSMQALPQRGAPVDHEVRVRAWRDGARVHVEIADTGPGIPEDALPRIFEPFFTTKPAGEGTGLGLSICHGIITAMGGDITARNLDGRGAAFTVWLPVPPRVLERESGRGD